MRLQELGIRFDPPARNTYPDFRLIGETEGYEVKGLAYPGREANYDANSQVPSGFHNGRTIYYMFGRYPTDVDVDDYPVIDLVMCHGDFLNADHTYVHKNKSIKGFGSYGDIMIRDRKMYVAPTPFALIDGTTGQRTLVLPANMRAPANLVRVGNLERIESRQLVVGYKFDLRNNTLTTETIENPAVGKSHRFAAYRAPKSGGPQVTMRATPLVDVEQPDEK